MSDKAVEVLAKVGKCLGVVGIVLELRSSR
jgi:hypothetical protein